MACEIEVGVNVNPCCPCIEAGQVRAIVFIRSLTSVTDFTVLADWQAAETAGNIRKFSATIGSKPVSSPTEGPGFGWASYETTGREHTLSARVKFSAANRDFFNAINQDGSWYLCYVTETTLFVTQAPVTVNADVDVPEDKNGQVTHTIACKWKTIELDKTYPTTNTLAFFQACDA